MKYTSDEVSRRAAEMVLYAPPLPPMVMAPGGGLEAAKQLPTERKPSDNCNAGDHIVVQTANRH